MIFEHSLTERDTRTACYRREFAGEDEEWQFLPAGNARRVGVLALENAELLLKEQDLDIFIAVVVPSHQDEIKHYRPGMGQKQENHGTGVAGTVPSGKAGRRSEQRQGWAESSGEPQMDFSHGTG